MIQEHCILDDVYSFCGRFVRYPSEEAHIAHTLWIAHTHLIEAFYITPRFIVQSAERRSGKSRLAEITKLLVQNPLSSINMSGAAMYTALAVAKDKREPIPTLLLDEIDQLLEKKDTA